MKKIYIGICTLVFVLSLILLTLFIGCGRKPQKITLGYVSTGLTGLAVQVMKDMKIPEKHGIEFEYIGFLDPSSLNNAFVISQK
jgi:hypothetical protein